MNYKQNDFLTQLSINDALAYLGWMNDDNGYTVHTLYEDDHIRAIVQSFRHPKIEQTLTVNDDGKLDNGVRVVVMAGLVACAAMRVDDEVELQYGEFSQSKESGL